jgi:gluconolactonase
VIRGHAWTIRLMVGMTLISLPGGCAPTASTTSTPTAAATADSMAPGAVSDARWKCPLPPGSYSPIGAATDLPAAQRLAGVPPADGFGRGFSIIEGPVWLGDALYVSQIGGGAPPPPSRLLKVVPGSPATVVAPNAGTNGLAILPNGDLVGAASLPSAGSVSLIPLSSPTDPVPIAGLFGGARFNSPNDLAVRSDGNIYFSDPTWQAPNPSPQAKTRVYRISPPPEAAVSVIDDTLGNPNGVTLSLDENTLYVSGPGLYKYPVNADGSVGARQDAVPDPTAYSGSDGMALDCAGDLYVATGSRVTVIDPSGNKVRDITIPVNVVGAVTNVAFGGADHGTLFITTLGSTPGIFTIAMPLPGMPY